MARNGNKIVTKLRKFVNGKRTNETKDNLQGDDHYIEPYIDKEACPPYVAQPVPAPAVVPQPAPAATLDPQPDPTTCNECFTENLPDQTTKCTTYKITNNESFEAYLQYKDCKTGQLTRYTARMQSIDTIESLTQPYKMYGANVTIASEDIETDGYVDQSKFHYRAVNCSDSNDFRFVKSKSQLDFGKIVKTELSSCCWEIYSASGPVNAYEVSSTTYDSCVDCCTGTVANTNDGVISIGPDLIDDTGASVENYFATNTCASGIQARKIFSIEEGGDINITFTLEVTGGRFAKAKARIMKIGDGKNGAVWEYPRNGYFETTNEVETYKQTLRVPAGVFRIEIDPVICASGSGQAEATVDISI